MNETINQKERKSFLYRNSVTLKLVIISILTLLLLIPSSMIKSTIREREQLNRTAINEVSSKWANSQCLKGPILSIPLLFEYRNDDETTELVKYLHILPDNLNIDGIVEPESLKRGIYKIVVYKSDLIFNGSFNISRNIEFSNLKEVKWDKAFLTIGISDLRGIEENITLKWNNSNLNIIPGSRIPDIINTGITIDIPDLANLNNNYEFMFDLKLQGSQNLSFTPVGSVTDIQLKSGWKTPSFNGNFLPRNRDVSEDGFSANWKVLQLNRNFPKQWIGSQYSKELNKSSLGVDLILPLDDYQKSMRSVKYAIMTIALTFLIFFLVEILNGRKIHVLQYALVGFGLCLFYILLISISEHTNFNFAYAISGVAIVSIISLYSLSLFKRKKLTLLLLGVLSGIYGFLFVTLQMADYALLMGSIGLTLILAITMYSTRKINWYQINNEIEG
jgi:inner membrane protein